VRLARQLQVERRRTLSGLRSLVPALLMFLACTADLAVAIPSETPELDPPARADQATLEPERADQATIEPELADPSELRAELVAATPEAIAAALAAAEQEVHELGIRAKLRYSPAGPLPSSAGLEPAYAERRAFALAGDLDQVRDWMALAKFGTDTPADTARRGPLADYDLIVTRESEHAWLHVIVPVQGLDPDQHPIGRHEAYVAGERWINLADRLEPGRHYLPYKTNGKESIDRQWGRVDVIEALAEIADDYEQRTGLLLGVGDISHVTGGKILDHWTHREGVDADLYLLDHQHLHAGRPSIWWHHFRKARSIWSSEPLGKGKREPRLDPEDELSDTPTSQRLRVLAQIVFPRDPIAYFVHDDPRVLASFDREVGERRPGRRYLHAQNRGMWPRHCDHVHLRGVDGDRPVGGTPRP